MLLCCIAWSCSIDTTESEFVDTSNVCFSFYTLRAGKFEPENVSAYYYSHVAYRVGRKGNYCLPFMATSYIVNDQ